MKQYAYGFDFGTDSCRLSCVELKTGEVIGEISESYPHGVISETLDGGRVRLSPDTCLQEADDYIEVLCRLSRRMLKTTGLDPEQIACIGSDFTNCTVVPMAADGRALCQIPELRDNPHAYVKLWKHHAAEYCAADIEAYALEHWPRIRDYGRNVSSEWLFPKVLQVLREDEELYRLTDTYIEACDWIVMQMTGNLIRGSACLGLNAFYNEDEGGYPDREFFTAIDPRFGDVVEDKMRGEVRRVGERAGTLLPEMARRMGLHPGAVVAVGHGDSEVATCGAGVADEGTMLFVMGTSTCQQMMYRSKSAFDGLCAVVKDGMIPGMYSYESGQPAVGDIFRWFAENCVSEELIKESAERGISMLRLLDEKAQALAPGECGIMCLDWLNGNRSVLMDYSLSGLSVGMTLESKPWEIYRAYIEATAYGCRRIVESYAEAGVPVKRFVASGGLPHKSPCVAQVYSDILGSELHVPDVSNMSSLGSAVCAAVALGSKNGGYDSFADAVGAMVNREERVYTPDPERAAVYNELYEVYGELYDYFGKASDVMKRLRSIKERAGGARR